jgi:hypothetical protein
MKTMRTYILSAAAALLLTASGAFAQTTTTTTTTNVEDNFNHPPCDFSDAFYQGIPGDTNHPGNDINVTQLNSAPAQRFGMFRQFGPPASGFQANWVVDPTCSTNDPDRKNIRILATTAGYPDDGTGTPNNFISIIAFLTNQNFFNGVANKRGIFMADIISNFEAYAALKQRLPDGTFATQPCGSLRTSTTTPCFPVTSVATPQLRQDWRFATNRNALDGSDNNDPLGVVTGTVNNTPYGYFCDDLLGAWIVTYIWFTVDPANPGPVCGPIFTALKAKNGTSLDGTPIIKTAEETNVQIEGNGCGAEGKLAMTGTDGGAIWIICPAIMDPRNGAIARDAFLDQVKLPNGQPLDPGFNPNFNCLQSVGQFPQANGQCVAQTDDL